MKTMLPLTVKIIIDKRSSDASYVAYTPELDVSSCGPTEQKARQNLKEAVGIVLDEIQKNGKLEEVLQELGFQKDKQGWIPPSVSFEPFYFPSI